MIARIIRWLGLGVVLAAAAVLSFDALRNLAMAVSIPVELAWLMPVAVDAGAAVSCACWLGRDIPKDAQGFARSLTYSLLLLTVAGNAAQLGMHAAGIVPPPWWVAVLVGAIPPVVVGGTVHLAVLVGRAQDKPDETLHSVPNPRAARDALAEQWKLDNPAGGARTLATYLTEKGYPLSPSGAASAYLKSAS